MKIPDLEGIASFDSLRAAALRAARGERSKPSVAAFLVDLETEVLALQRELLEGCWRPRALMRFRIVDPKPRIIAASHFRDRVVHHALCTALEPMFERYSIFDSYACRPGKGGHAAIRRAQAFSRNNAWFCKIDVRRYFETVDHDLLLWRLARRGVTGRVLELARIIVHAGGPGLPIGSLTSQHFGNLYLGALDHRMKDDLGVRAYLRYMDDILFVGPERETVMAWRREAERFLRENLRLEVKDEALRQGPVSDGIPLLGFRVWPGLIRLDGARKRRWFRKMSAVQRGLASGALGEDEAAARARGLLAWAEGGDTMQMRRSFFARRLDAEARGR
jgi:hypothetical protein